MKDITNRAWSYARFNPYVPKDGKCSSAPPAGLSRGGFALEGSGDGVGLGTTPRTGDNCCRITTPASEMSAHQPNALFQGDVEGSTVLCVPVSTIL